MAAKPNILLISADQWRGDCLGIAGHPVVRTPHADALAREGALFARHYAGSAPCGPARAGLYTGLYQMNHRVVRNGTPLDDRFDNIARAARRRGYDPTLFGYTDVAIDPRTADPNDPRLSSYEGILPGFTVRQLLPEDEKPWHSWLRKRGHAFDDGANVHRPPGSAPDAIDPSPPRYSRDETQTAFLAGAFLDWLAEQDRETAWFAHVSFMRPHPPFVVPEPFNRMYDPDDGPAFVRHGSRDEEAALHPFVAYRLKRQKKADYYPGAKGRVRDWKSRDFKQLRALYYGMISEVDDQLGRIFTALKAKGAWDKTIVVLTSDHGEMIGDHWTLGKAGFFDASYHIPLIIRAPRTAALNDGRTVKDFTEASDIFPTLLHIMELEPLNGIDGRSLMPLLTGKGSQEWRDAALWEFDFRGIAKRRAETHFGLDASLCNMTAYRDAAFKYVHFAGLPPLLFDLGADPGELENVADHPDYLSTRLAYAEKLLSWRTRHLDQTLAYAQVTDEGLQRLPYPL